MPLLRFRYQTIELGAHDLHVRTLRDTLEFRDDGGVAEALGISSATWPLFGVVWPSGLALARLMVDFDVAGRRVLEVGCGIGLASLLLNKRGSDITATDYHPEAAGFLAVNVDLNDGAAIPFVRTGWHEEDAAVSGLGRYDLIIASDVLYERGHASLLSAFIDRHAHRGCEVVLLDPGRGSANRFTRLMTARGYTHSQAAAHLGDDPDAPYRGQQLRYRRAA